VTVPSTARGSGAAQELPVASPTRPVVLGLVAAPGAPADLARWLGDELARALGERHPEVTWEVRPVVHLNGRVPSGRSTMGA
jgi:hypothetical protein